MVKKLTFISTIFLVPLLCFSQEKGMIRHDTPDSLYIQLAANYPASAALHGPGGGSFCSCALVSPTLVLTAAHCIDEDANGIPDFGNEIYNSTVRFGPGAGNWTLSANVDTFFLFPAWHQAGALHRKEGNDIAIIRLEAPVTGIQPATISLQDPVGHEGTSVGYGTTGNGNDDTLTATYDERKRATMNLIEFKSPLGPGFAELGSYNADFDKPDGTTNTLGDYVQNELGITLTSTATPLPLEGGPAPGDSGSSLYVDFNDGNGPVIVGVVSAGGNPLSEASPFGYGGIAEWASFTNPGVPEFLAAHGLISATANLNTPQTEQLFLYPNPASDQVFIASETPLSVSVMNLTGQKVATWEIHSGKTSVDLKPLPNGTYFLTTNRQVVHRLVISH